MPASSSSPIPTTPSGDGVVGDEQQTRQVLVRKAMDGIQRFKQSWKSVMLLKAGVGLGQVIVLVVLLILASSISSPLFPSLTQNQPSDACTHPHLFQAWMGVQIARLTICWGVSCWICIRTERRRRRRRAEREAEEREELEDGSETVTEARPTILPRDADSFSSRVAPSLIHSMSSTSTLITGNTSAPSTPAMNHASSSRLDLSCVLELEHMPDQEELDLERGQKTRKRTRETSAMAVASPSGDHLAPPRPPLRGRQSTRSLRQARELLHGDIARQSAHVPAKGFAGWLDRHALKISRTLGLISTVLFILGNILLFYPPPSDYSCYAANPLLWWGVLTVTAVGWVLLLQVFFVVVIVGLGGAVVLNALQRLGVIPAPAEPERPREAQPEPLTPAELTQIKIMSYLSESSSVPLTRLPHPPLYLSPDQSTCAICQENFAAPKEGRTILLNVDKVRQLGCSHTYHMSCIDQWLLKGSGNCPSCNAAVRPALQTTAAPRGSAPSTPRAPRRTRREASQGSPV